MTRHSVLFSLSAPSRASQQEESPWSATLLARFAAVSTTERLFPTAERLPLRLRAFGHVARTAGRVAAFASPSARALVSGLGQRRMLGHWAAAALPGRPRSGVTVIAPSLAAREVFARAQARGLRTALFLDLPHFLALHGDLDRAALRLPDDDYLRHFRAPAWAIARQRAELELADEVLVRGDYAASLVAPRLRPQQQLAVIAPAPSGPRLAHDRAAEAPLLLAGPASARGGFPIAAAAAARLGRPLLARRSPATEPRYLGPAVAGAPSGFANVRWLAEGEPLPPVAAVLAPALCESYVHLQAPAQLPIIASDRAAVAHTGGATSRWRVAPEAELERQIASFTEAVAEALGRGRALAAPAATTSVEPVEPVESVESVERETSSRGHAAIRYESSPS